MKIPQDIYEATFSAVATDVGSASGESPQKNEKKTIKLINEIKKYLNKLYDKRDKIQMMEIKTLIKGNMGAHKEIKRILNLTKEEIEETSEIYSKIVNYAFKRGYI